MIQKKYRIEVACSWSWLRLPCVDPGQPDTQVHSVSIHKRTHRHNNNKHRSKWAFIPSDWLEIVSIFVLFGCRRRCCHFKFAFFLLLLLDFVSLRFISHKSFDSLDNYVPKQSHSLYVYRPFLSPLLLLLLLMLLLLVVLCIKNGYCVMPRSSQCVYT